MSSEENFTLTQEEIDRVMNNVRADTLEQENVTPLTDGISLSQSELDALFGKNTKSTYINTAAQEKAAPADRAPEPEKQPVEKTPQNHAAKIAARRAQAAALLAKVNASSPKRVQVVYGTTLYDDEKIDALAPGSLIELDRLSTDSADVYVDGKLVAKGRLGSIRDHAGIKITEIYK